jgi:hypothetical protein
MRGQIGKYHANTENGVTSPIPIPDQVSIAFLAQWLWYCFLQKYHQLRVFEFKP